MAKIEDKRNCWISWSDIPIYLTNETEIFDYVNQLPHVIYSPQCKWGLICSLEKFGILAGVEDLIDDVCRHLPHIEREIDIFLAEAQEARTIDRNFSLDWIVVLLENMYVTDSTNKRWAEVGLSSRK
jgi:hypothetical protein